MQPERAIKTYRGTYVSVRAGDIGQQTEDSGQSWRDVQNLATVADAAAFASRVTETASARVRFRIVRRTIHRDAVIYD